MEGDAIADVSFRGQGCAISKASASLMTTAVKGKSRAEAEALFDRFHQLVIGKLPESEQESLGSLRALGGVSKFPLRVKCASLAWHALHSALEAGNEDGIDRTGRPRATAGGRRMIERSDFPLLAANPDLHYLDSAATSQKPRAVLDAMMQYYSCDNANPHRGAYALSARATERYHDARERIARFIGVQDAARVIFTRGTTESLNLVAPAWGRANVQRGRRDRHHGARASREFRSLAAARQRRGRQASHLRRDAQR